MNEEALLTVRQLAAELELPESTIRFYRDAFIEHIPSVGTGRRRRYPSSAIAILRSIADGYAYGMNRSEITTALGGGAVRQVAVRPRQPVSAPTEEGENDVLAVVLNNAREQRNFLWQIAREIVRLTQALEGQDRILRQLADRAGIAAEPTITAQGPVAAIAPAPTTGGLDLPQLEQLRAELEAERALVERLREAKLQVERRAADAEAALDEQRPKRPSMIARLLGKSDQ